MRSKWVRPYGRGRGRGSKTPNCLDCEHYRVAGFPNRMCVQYPSKHMWHMATEVERNETGEVVAEGCPKWALASEYQLSEATERGG